jgi:hypothetical protein
VLTDIRLGQTQPQHVTDHPVDSDALLLGDANSRKQPGERAVPGLRGVSDDVVAIDSWRESPWTGDPKRPADVFDNSEVISPRSGC